MPQIGIAEERERDLLAGGELGLFVAALGADPDHRGAERVELGQCVAVGALRGAAAGAGDVVPAGGQGCTGRTGAWVEVGDEKATGRLRQVEVAITDRRQRQRGDRQPRQVVGGAVVLRDRQLRRQRGVVGTDPPLGLRHGPLRGVPAGDEPW